MRMTRRRRYILRREHQNTMSLRHYRGTKSASMAVVGAIGMYLPLAAEAANITVMQEIHDDFKYMQGKADDAIALDKARGYLKQAIIASSATQQNLLQAEMSYRQADAAVKTAAEHQQQAENSLQAARRDVQLARMDVTRKSNRVTMCQQAVSDYHGTWQAAYQRLADVRAVYEAEEGAAPEPVVIYSGNTLAEQERAAAIMAEWEKVGFQQNKLTEIEARFSHDSDGGTTEYDNSAADAYWARMDMLSAQVESAEFEFDLVNDTYDRLKDELAEAIDAENEARDTLAELEDNLEQAKSDLQDADDELAESKRERAEALENRIEAELDRDEAFNARYDIRNSIRHMGQGDGFSTRLEYYSWSGGGYSGSQFYQPFEYYHADENITLGLTTGYLRSNTGAANGQMSGWTDTTLDVTHLNKKNKYDVRYGIAFNIPTGQSRVYDNAIVPENVARFDRMGTGWNFTPKLEITHKIDKANSATWRSEYSFRGGYHNSKDDWNSYTNPGNTWHNELEYLRVTEHTQFMARLGYQMIGDSQLNGVNYQEGNELIGKLYYTNWYDKENAILSYFAYAGQAAAENSESTHRTYFGLGWEHRFNEKHDLKLMFNMMKATGNSYDPVLRRTYLAGNRQSISLEYQWKINDNSSICLDVEKFINKNDIGVDYRGWQTMLTYNMSF